MIVTLHFKYQLYLILDECSFQISMTKLQMCETKFIHPQTQLIYEIRIVQKNTLFKWNPILRFRHLREIRQFSAISRKNISIRLDFINGKTQKIMIKCEKMSTKNKIPKALH